MVTERDFMNADADLPNGWEWAKLGEIGKYVNGMAFKPSDWKSKGRPIIRIQNLTGSTSVTHYFNGFVEEDRIVRSGDFLISWSATLDAFIWNGEEAVLNQHIFKVYPWIDKKFLYYCVKNFLRTLTAKVHGTGMQHITKGKFDETVVPIAPLAEQRKIVEKIEELFKESRIVKQSLDGISEIMKKFRPSMISILLTKNNKADLVPLKTLLREPLRNGKSALPSNDNKGIPVLKLSAVTFKDFSSSNVKICNLQKSHVDDLWVKKNDILISRSNTIEYVGMGVIYEGKNDQFIFPDLMIRVRVNENIIRPKFLAFFLDSSLARDHFRRNASGTAGTMPKISQNDIENLLVPVPSLDEQDVIVQKIAESFSLADKINASVEDAKRRTDKIDQTILYKAFLGELVPQDPNNESASVLLERIRKERELKIMPTKKNKLKK